MYESKTGFVANCDRLNIRKRPNLFSSVICEIEKNTEVMINFEESTDSFYKIYTVSGIEGYCMKPYILVT